MLAYILFGSIINFCKLQLCEPYIFISKPDVNLRDTILILVDDDAVSIVWLHITLLMITCFMGKRLFAKILNVIDMSIIGRDKYCYSDLEERPYHSFIMV